MRAEQELIRESGSAVDVIKMRDGECYRKKVRTYVLLLKKFQYVQKFAEWYIDKVQWCMKDGEYKAYILRIAVCTHCVV